MNTLIFRVDADHLDTHVLDSIKAFFGHREIEISVKSVNAEAADKTALLDKIEAGKQADYEYRLSAEQLNDYIHQGIAGEPANDGIYKYVLLPTTTQPA